MGVEEMVWVPSADCVRSGNEVGGHALLVEETEETEVGRL
jgi:hypothetical protein